MARVQDEPDTDSGRGAVADERAQAAASDQPYVGPRPFEQQNDVRFHGRDREATDLAYLIIAERELVLYAQSGAGKTSMINAKVIPLLVSEGFDVLPIVRVQALLPTGSEQIPNVFAFNAISSLDPDAAAAPPVAQTIADYLAQRPHTADADGVPGPRVIIFDQFEELFTAYPERWKDRQAFFEQVRDALRVDLSLRILFVIREDYLANLERYAAILPDRLSTRVHLERPRKDQALVMIEKPLLSATPRRRFAAGVVEELVKSLLTLEVTTADNDRRHIEEEFVELVQLQVVCRTLWRALPADVTEITAKHRRDLADVGQALSRFYDDSIRDVAAATGVQESILRRWFERACMTPNGTRSIVYRGPSETAGLANAAVDEFEKHHLLVSRLRGSDQWYELSHDRFIEPIRASNRNVAKGIGSSRSRSAAAAARSQGVGMGR
jgi:hypothetical protein